MIMTIDPIGIELLGALWYWAGGGAESALRPYDRYYCSTEDAPG